MINDEQQGFKVALRQEMRVLKTQIPPVLKTADRLWVWLKPEQIKRRQSYWANTVTGDSPGGLLMGQYL